MSLEESLNELKGISFKRLFDLSSRKAVVTGGGGGICSAIAYGLAEFGADIALIDLNVENLEKVKNFLKERFPERKVMAFVANVCSYDEVVKAVDNIVKEFGRIDILVNCHGIGQWVSAEAMGLDDWNRMIYTNLTSIFIVSQVVGRYMIKQRYGKIINIASMSGHIVNTPQPQSHYNTSKAGVIHLTKSLAAEWAKYNIYVNSVSPGYTLTPLVEKLLNQEPRYAELWKSMIPLNRFAKPYDIVGAVIFLASDASNYVTGTDILVDGGYTIL